MIIGLAQYPVTFHHSWEEWALHIARWVADGAAKGAQLLVFPEYGSMELVSLMDEAARGDLQRQVREMEHFREEFMATFEKLAQKHNVTIVAPSFPVMENGKTYNRTWVFSGKGYEGYQDKWMMTRFETESWLIDAGRPELAVFETAWCRFGIQICYDVEFPIGSALLCRRDVELILAPSCTETVRGATRVHVGARARALENQCFVGVAQVIGDAPWSLAVDVNYGYAAVYSTADLGLPEDGIVAISQPQEPGWLVQALDFELIKNVRNNGAVFNFKNNSLISYKL